MRNRIDGIKRLVSTRSAHLGLSLATMTLLLGVSSLAIAKREPAKPIRVQSPQANSGAVCAARSRATTAQGWRWVLCTPVRHVQAGGVDFAYRSIGSGPPLLLMLGLEDTMSSGWDPAVLAQLARVHRLIIYDHRGTGLSRGDVSHMTIQQLADDASHLIHALHLGRPDVWGQSMGGFVAQELAIRHPRDLRRLVLTATSYGSGRWIPTRVTLPRPGDRAGILRILFTPGRAGRAAMRGFVRRVSLWHPQEIMTTAGRGAEYAAVANFLFVRGKGSWEELRHVGARVLVADGRHDVVNPPGNARRLARRLRHAALRLYPSGHFFYTQDQTLFVPDLLRFLGGR